MVFAVPRSAACNRALHHCSRWHLHIAGWERRAWLCSVPCDIHYYIVYVLLYNKVFFFHGCAHLQGWQQPRRLVVLKVLYAAAFFAHGCTPDYTMRLILLSSLRKNAVAATSCSASCGLGARKPVLAASSPGNSVLRAFRLLSSCELPRIAVFGSTLRPPSPSPGFDLYPTTLFFLNSFPLYAFFGHWRCVQ